MGRKKRSKQQDLGQLDVESLDEPSQAPGEVEALSLNEDAVSDDEAATGTFSRPDFGASTQSQELAAQPEKQAASRRSRRKKSDGGIDAPPNDESSLIAITSKNAELAVGHWEAIEKITQSISRHLERISQQLEEVSLHVPPPPAIIQRPTPQRVTLLNRVTLGMSAVALLLGLVGVSLSQSAREQLLKRQSPVLESSGAQAYSAPSAILNDPLAPPDLGVKRPSELSRRHREAWKSRRQN